MNIRNWFKRKTDKPIMEQDLLHAARMESLRKKTETSNEIIEMMKDFKVERRVVDITIDGPERRHA